VLDRVHQLRLFVLEPNAILRWGVLGLLAGEPSIDLVGVSEDVGTAEVACRRLSPSVAIIGGPVEERGPWIPRILTTNPFTQVVALLGGEAAAEGPLAIAAGASTYVTPGVDRVTLVTAIRLAATGAVLHELQPPTVDPGLAGLSGRQREVLALLGAGLTRKTIAYRLGIAEGTVKTHLGHIFTHLGVHGRSEAALAARRIGLVPQVSGTGTR